MPGRIMPHTHTVAEKHSHAPIYTHERALGSFSGPLLKIKDKTEAEISERFFPLIFFIWCCLKNKEYFFAGHGYSEKMA